MGECQTGVSVKLDDAYFSLTPENTERFFLLNVLPKFAKEQPRKATQTELV